MNRRTARKLIPRLHRTASSASDPLSRRIARVALSWVKRAVSAKDLDVVARLQVLEGAAGLGDPKGPSSVWAKRPYKKGLAAARDYFAGDNVDPSWFSEGNTGSYTMLWKSVDSMLRGDVASGVDTDDFMQAALAGLGAVTMAPRLRMTWAAGRDLAAGIKDGRETPRSVFGGKIKTWIKKVWRNEVDKARRHEEINLTESAGRPGTPGGPGSKYDEDTEVSPGVRAPVVHSSDPGAIILRMLEDTSDPMHRDVVALAKRTWKPRNLAGRFWLEYLRRLLAGQDLSNNAIAKALKTDKTNASKAKKKGWQAFEKAYQKDRNIMRSIEVRQLQYDAGRQASLKGVLNLKIDVRTKQGSLIPAGKQVTVSRYLKSTKVAVQVLDSGQVFWVPPKVLPKILR